MKFRYKGLIMNLILLSLATGIVGFLLMQRSYRTGMDSEIRSAVAENNLIQSSVEYSLLDVLNNKPYNLESSLQEIGDSVYNSMLSGEEALYIRFKDSFVYQCSEADTFPSDQIFEYAENNRKNYMLHQEEDKLYLYVTSYTPLEGSTMHVVTRRDVTVQHDMLNQSIQNYRQIILILFAVATLLLLILSRLLTRHLERLSDATEAFASGDYSARTTIHSSDEVGQLADGFNIMADSVESHVEELSDMVKRREQFVADFTHEIKTPMTSIIGYADTMRSMDLSKEEQQQALGYIFSEGKRLESMSMKLFDLLYLKDHPIDIRPFSANALSENVASSMSPLLNTSGITLDVSVDAALLSGDPELLQTVFINLIDNARKASKKGDTIEFTGRKESDTSYSFMVRDHGIGISEEDQKKIFDEFYMVDKSRTREAGGAGLGMSLVSVILQRHDAKLNLESALGEGTTVTVTLPCSEDREGGAHEEE